MESCLAFRLPGSGVNTHVVDLQSCGACISQPLPCSAVGCDGLVHNEDCYDGDEGGVYAWIEYACDRCSSGLDFDEVSLSLIEKHWPKHEEQQRRQLTRLKIETRLTADQIVDAWYASAMEASTAPRPVNLQMLVSSSRPDIAAIPPPKGGGVSLLELYQSSKRTQLFRAFEKRLDESREDYVLRAAAIACYWQLSRATLHVWEDDHNPVKRLFSAMLGMLVSYGDIRYISSWEEAEWELTNSFACSDWMRARQIFRRAHTHDLHDKEALRWRLFQFEALLLLGTYADDVERSTHEEHSHDVVLTFCSYGRYTSLCVNMLTIPPGVFAWSSGTEHSRPLRFLLALPLLDRRAPDISKNKLTRLEEELTKSCDGGSVDDPMPWEDDIDHVKSVRSKVEEQLLRLQDRGVVQRALLALLLEGAGRHAEAADHYRLLATGYREFLSGLQVYYLLKAGEQFKLGGSRESAVELCLDLMSDGMASTSIIMPLIRLAISLGLVTEAKQFLMPLQARNEELFRDPFLKALLVPEQQLLFDERSFVEEQCLQWTPFKKLNRRSQDSWRNGLLFQSGAKKMDDYRREWERTAIVEFGRCVELDLKSIFFDFRTHPDLWKGRLVETIELKSFLYQDQDITFDRMIFLVTSGKVKGSAEAHLVNFISRQHPRLADYQTLRRLGELRKVRNTATHATPDLSVHEAQALARDILDAIHSS